MSLQRNTLSLDAYSSMGIAECLSLLANAAESHSGRDETRRSLSVCRLRLGCAINQLESNEIDAAQLCEVSSQVENIAVEIDLLLKNLEHLPS